jgi:hypothetical protein
MTIASSPVLPAFATKSGSWKVWCRYCNLWHYHGPLPGHRSAHCRVATSPYRRTGYVLQLAESAGAVGGAR